MLFLLAARVLDCASYCERRGPAVHFGASMRGRAPLRRDLLVGEGGDAGALGRVLDRERDDLPVWVELEERVFVEVARCRDRPRLELDVERVGVGEEGDCHGTKSRSKKALWIVSPSASSSTRR